MTNKQIDSYFTIQELNNLKLKNSKSKKEIQNNYSLSWDNQTKNDSLNCNWNTQLEDIEFLKINELKNKLCQNIERNNGKYIDVYILNEVKNEYICFLDIQSAIDSSKTRKIFHNAKKQYFHISSCQESRTFFVDIQNKIYNIKVTNYYQPVFLCDEYKIENKQKVIKKGKITLADINKIDINNCKIINDIEDTENLFFSLNNSDNIVKITDIIDEKITIEDIDISISPCINTIDENSFGLYLYDQYSLLKSYLEINSFNFFKVIKNEKEYKNFLNLLLSQIITQINILKSEYTLNEILQKTTINKQTKNNKNDLSDIINL